MIDCADGEALRVEPSSGRIDRRNAYARVLKEVRPGLVFIIDPQPDIPRDAVIHTASPAGEVAGLTIVRQCSMRVVGVAVPKQDLGIRAEIAVAGPGINYASLCNVFPQNWRFSRRTAIVEIASLDFQADSLQKVRHVGQGIVDPQCAAEKVAMAEIGVVAGEASADGQR